MPLDAGLRLGPYEILGPLGSGGMGEVYRAKDTRLDRLVALKILPASVASDPQFRERFDREARAISALEHPHICALYDVGESPHDPRFPDAEPIRYLVIQYLDGETLESRLAKGPLPVSEALTIAIQIADALATAHRAGVVHRDLKPGNIMLIRSGAKLLDFGLAKIATPAIAVTATMAPTTPAAVTTQGTILGTFQYMAPEQIEGLEADARTDIFAFGAVLYEMLTGRRAFEGKSRASLIGAILKDEPRPVSQVQPLAPSSLDRIVSTCLAKDPDDRWQSARDLLRELKWAAAGGAATSAPVAPVPAPSSRRRMVLAAIGGLALGVASAAVAIWIGSRLTVRHAQPIRLEIGLPPGQSLLLTTPDRHIAISPDGTLIAYAAGPTRATAQLWTRRLDQLEAMPLGVAGVWPFFSPDGHWIGFFIGGELKKVSITGGVPVTLCRYNGAPRGASWGADGTIVFATTDLTTGLLAVSQDASEPRVLTKPGTAHGELDHAYPFLLPDGRVLLTVDRSGLASDAEIAVANLQTGARTTLVRGGTQAEYVEPGYLLYAALGTIRAVPFDPRTDRIAGDPVPVADRLLSFPNGATEYAISSLGTFVYVPGDAGGSSLRSLVWADRKGHEEPIDAPPRPYDMARLSPDGTRVALPISDPAADIWIWDLARHTLTPLSRIPGAENLPVWTPDSRRIIFNSSQTGPRNLFEMAADGTGVARRLTTSDNNQFPFSISRDGSRLFLGEVAPQTQADVRMLALEGAAPADARSTEILIQTPAREFGAQISPNGRWLAYQSDESGQFEIYVRPFPNINDDRIQISTAGGTRALWARSGLELFYLDNDDILTAVTVDGSSARFSAGKPARVLNRKYYSGSNLASYDVSPDGQRFLMIKEDRPGGVASTQDRVVVVLNWLDELKQRLQGR